MNLKMISQIVKPRYVLEQEVKFFRSTCFSQASLVGIAVVAPQPGESDDIPAWVIIVPIIIGVLIIICIVVALYFVS